MAVTRLQIALTQTIKCTSIVLAYYLVFEVFDNSPVLVHVCMHFFFYYVIVLLKIGPIGTPGLQGPPGIPGDKGTTGSQV